MVSTVSARGRGHPGAAAALSPFNQLTVFMSDEANQRLAGGQNPLNAANIFLKSTQRNLFFFCPVQITDVA